MIGRASFLVPVAGVLAVAALFGCGEPAAPEPSPIEPPGLEPEPQAPLANTVTVSNLTTGGAFDLDGFDVVLDGRASALLELNARVMLANVAEGTHTVALTGVSSNCRVLDGPAKGVTVGRGAGAELSFEVACTPPPELARLRIVFARAAGVADGRHPSSLVALNADGSGRVQLTSGAFNDYGPDVSPDGRTIVFMRDEPRGGPTPDIYTITSDGPEVLLIRGPAYDPDWSPDGTRIAYLGPVGHWGGPIMVARSDGGGVTPLTGQDPDMEDAWPAWSPDGTRLAFTRSELSPTGGSTRIWLMGSDGSGAHPVSASGAYMPMWSPDGRMIAFRDWTGQGHVINADGSGLVALLPSTLVFDDWSADGRFLLFSQGGRGRYRSDVYLFELDTGTITRLTADGAYNRDAVFWKGPSDP